MSSTEIRFQQTRNEGRTVAQVGAGFLTPAFIVGLRFYPGSFEKGTTALGGYFAALVLVVILGARYSIHSLPAFLENPELSPGRNPFTKDERCDTEKLQKAPLERLIPFGFTPMKRYFDIGSLLVILLTLVLFVVALVEKGFTHDLLLETGVFLVSLKLILMSYKTSVATAEMQGRLDEILAAVRSQSAGSIEPVTQLR